MSGPAWRLVVTGAARDWAADAVSDYEGRLARYVDLETTVLKEPEWAEKDPAKYFRWIGEEYLGRLGKTDVAVALDPGAPALTSPAFAGELRKRFAGDRRPVFWIGGSQGLGPALLSHASWKVSFGPMTYPHALFRVMLLEQLYRAQTILRGEKYHK
ncbi:MAG: 23S rRNA (pseudouridine(1915)-N(3))-methyltransferase RlmH [Spirochaetes bacterium]|nr:23S rRNA (pseudouridine(1915)-N(3))-methyltransferase RlmH [Spirochaetota bacterium]